MQEPEMSSMESRTSVKEETRRLKGKENVGAFGDNFARKVLLDDSVAL